MPFAIWFFLAVEGVPLAAEEAKEPERNVPKGIIAAMGLLLVTATTVLVLTAGAGGAEAMSASGNPLVEALGDSTMAKVVNYIGLAGLIASFFSIIYAYSRQLFALSRAGYLPKSLSVVNSRKAPTLALIVPGVIGFVLSLTGQGAMLLNMAVFGAALSYVLMMVSHIVLRVREPDMPRPYRTPGGIVTTSFALVIAALSVVATFLVDSTAALWCLVVFAGVHGLFRALQPPQAWWPTRPTKSSRRSRPRRKNWNDAPDAAHRARRWRDASLQRPGGADGQGDAVTLRRRTGRLRGGLRRRTRGRSVGAGRHAAGRVPRGDGGSLRGR